MELKDKSESAEEDTSVSCFFLFSHLFSSSLQMDQLSDEEVEVREDDEEEDSDKEDQDLDKMFGAWLGELDKLTQVHKVREVQRLICMEHMRYCTGRLLGYNMCNIVCIQSLDDGHPEEPPQQKAPLRQETNMANFSYRFSIYNINGTTL